MWKYTLKYGKYTFYKFDEYFTSTKKKELAESIIREFNARRIGV